VQRDAGALQGSGQPKDKYADELLWAGICGHFLSAENCKFDH